MALQPVSSWLKDDVVLEADIERSRTHAVEADRAQGGRSARRAEGALPRRRSVTPLSRLDGEDPAAYPAGEMVATQNGLLHLPTRVLVPHTPTLLLEPLPAVSIRPGRSCSATVAGVPGRPVGHRRGERPGGGTPHRGTLHRDRQPWPKSSATPCPAIPASRNSSGWSARRGPGRGPSVGSSPASRGRTTWPAPP